MGKELKITHRHLPHWTLDGSIYFVTFHLQKATLTVEEQIIVMSHIKEGDGKFYDCFAAVVMPDHVHCLLRPPDGISLSRVMKGIKGVSAHKVNQHRKTEGTIWQNESFDRIVRNEKEYNQKFLYMLNNPVTRGLTSDPLNYAGWFCNNRLNE